MGARHSVNKVAHRVTYKANNIRSVTAIYIIYIVYISRINHKTKEEKQPSQATVTICKLQMMSLL